MLIAENWSDSFSDCWVINPTWSGTAQPAADFYIRNELVAPDGERFALLWVAHPHGHRRAWFSGGGVEGVRRIAGKRTFKVAVAHIMHQHPPGEVLIVAINEFVGLPHKIDRPVADCLFVVFDAEEFVFAHTFLACAAVSPPDSVSSPSMVLVGMQSQVAEHVPLPLLGLAGGKSEAILLRSVLQQVNHHVQLHRMQLLRFHWNNNVTTNLICRMLSYNNYKSDLKKITITCLNEADHENLHKQKKSKTWNKISLQLQIIKIKLLNGLSYHNCRSDLTLCFIASSTKDIWPKF